MLLNEAGGQGEISFGDVTIETLEIQAEPHEDLSRIGEKIWPLGQDPIQCVGIAGVFNELFVTILNFVVAESVFMTCCNET